MANHLMNRTNKIFCFAPGFICRLSKCYVAWSHQQNRIYKRWI